MSKGIHKALMYVHTAITFIDCCLRKNAKKIKRGLSLNYQCLINSTVPCFTRNGGIVTATHFFCVAVSLIAKVGIVPNNIIISAGAVVIFFARKKGTQTQKNKNNSISCLFHFTVLLIKKRVIFEA